MKPPEPLLAPLLDGSPSRNAPVMGRVMITDAQLLRDFQTHQRESAFRQLMERHVPMVRAVAFRILGRADDADDVAQEVFLKLAKKAGGLRTEPSLAGWLHRVAQGQALDHRRRQQRRTRHELAASRSVDPSLTPGGSSELPTVEHRELSGVVDHELASLPKKYRDPLVLHHLQQMKYAQAAEHLGCNANTFAARLRRGRDLLRDRLTRRGLAIPAMGLAAWLDHVSNASAAGAPVGPMPWNAILEASNAVKPINAKLIVALTLLVSILGSASFLFLYNVQAQSSKPKSTAKKNSKKPKVISSKPVTDQGLESWIELKSTTFDADFPSFSLHMKNVSDKAKALHLPTWKNRDLQIYLQPRDSKADYNVQLYYDQPRGQSTKEQTWIKPGKTVVLSFPIKAQPPKIAAGLHVGMMPMMMYPKAVPKGDYTLSVHWTHRPKVVPHEDRWVGSIKTTPVNVTINNKTTSPFAGAPEASAIIGGGGG